MGQFNFEAGNCVARPSKTRHHRLPVEMEWDVSREVREGGESAGARLNISSKTRHHRQKQKRHQRQPVPLVFAKSAAAGDRKPG